MKSFNSNHDDSQAGVKKHRVSLDVRQNKADHLRIAVADHPIGPKRDLTMLAVLQSHINEYEKSDGHEWILPVRTAAFDVDYGVGTISSANKALIEQGWIVITWDNKDAKTPEERKKGTRYTFGHRSLDLLNVEIKPNPDLEIFRHTDTHYVFNNSVIPRACELIWIALKRGDATAKQLHETLGGSIVVLRRNLVIMVKHEIIISEGKVYRINPEFCFKKKAEAMHIADKGKVKKLKLYAHAADFEKYADDPKAFYKEKYKKKKKL